MNECTVFVSSRDANLFHEKTDLDVALASLPGDHPDIRVAPFFWRDYRVRSDPANPQVASCDRRFYESFIHKNSSQLDFVPPHTSALSFRAQTKAARLLVELVLLADITPHKSITKRVALLIDPAQPAGPVTGNLPTIFHFRNLILTLFSDRLILAHTFNSPDDPDPCTTLALQEMQAQRPSPPQPDAPELFLPPQFAGERIHMPHVDFTHIPTAKVTDWAKQIMEQVKTNPLFSSSGDKNYNGLIPNEYTGINLDFVNYFQENTAVKTIYGAPTSPPQEELITPAGKVVKLPTDIGAHRPSADDLLLFEKKYVASTLLTLEGLAAYLNQRPVEEAADWISLVEQQAEAMEVRAATLRIIAAVLRGKTGQIGA